MGWGRAGLGAGESPQQRARAAQAAAGEAASAGRAAADEHGWELHVAQPKFLSWQQLFVETEGVLKRAPFYGPCDNNRECCNVITHVSELQRSDVSLPFGPFSPAGEGKVYSEEQAPSLLVVKQRGGGKKKPRHPKQTTQKNQTTSSVALLKLFIIGTARIFVILTMWSQCCKDAILREVSSSLGYRLSLLFA